MFLKSEMVVSNLKKYILGHILELLNLCLVKYESSYLSSITAWKVSVFRGFLVRIQSECGKIRTRKTPNTDTFHEANIFKARSKNLPISVINSNYSHIELSYSWVWPFKLLNHCLPYPTAFLWTDYNSEASSICRLTLNASSHLDSFYHMPHGI